MRTFSFSPVITMIIPFFLSWTTFNDPWNVENHEAFSLFYTGADMKNIPEYTGLIDNGIASVNIFFSDSFRQEFDVFIHPNRRSLDSTWQKDWGMPDFKSECWMVASGVAGRLDMISPETWGKEACEHHYSDKTKTQQLITHELVHVFHGQNNPSPDFSEVIGLDWFVEGLATYASGQCDAKRIADVQKAIEEGKVPESLDQLWSGWLKYSLSGSMVMYIDHKYGREKLTGLLKFNLIKDLLGDLNTTESALLDGWEAYIETVVP